MKSLIKIFVIVLVASSFTSCKKDSAPNYQFFPNMYESVGYETYGSYDIFPNEQAALLPVNGTIARGQTAFDFENSTDGYNLAKETLKSPLDPSKVDSEKGKQLNVQLLN